MIKGFAHNALTVTDMDASLKFYCDIAGLKKVFEIHDDNDKPWIVYCKICDGQFLELFHDGTKDPDYHYASDLVGFHHFCFEVDNIAEMAVKFHAAGLTATDQPHEGHDHNLSCFIEDPDGNGVEFVQFMPSSPQAKSIGR